MAGPERDETRQLLKLWRGFCGGKRLPDRNDVRMDELRAFEENIFLFDVEADNRYIVKQSSGLFQRRSQGLNIAGANILNFIRPNFRERLLARVNVAFSFGFAACTHTLTPFAYEGSWRTENLILPIASTDGNCRQVIAAIFYTKMDIAGAHGDSPPDMIKIVDECFIDISAGYAAIIDASELPYSVFPSNPEQGG